MNPWFRFYAKFMTDPDIEELSFEDQRHFVFVLCMKCSGLLDKDFGGDREKRERAIARRLGLQGEAFTFAKDRLVAANIINADWQPRSWERLQFKSDHDSAERQRRSRAKRGVTGESRDSHTLEQNRTEQIQSRAESAHAPGLDIPAWERFEQYRRDIRKSVKPASMQAAQRKLAGFGADQAAVVEQTIANSWAGLFALKDLPPGARRPEPKVDDGVYT